MLSIATYNKSLEVTPILDHYWHLFQIEQTFRTFKIIWKHDLCTIGHLKE